MAVKPVIASVGSISGPGAVGEGRNDLIIGELVSLSDDNSTNDGASYKWYFDKRPVGSGATISGASTATPTFVPDRVGTYRIVCVVDETFVSVIELSAPLPVVGSPEETKWSIQVQQESLSFLVSIDGGPYESLFTFTKDGDLSLDGDLQEPVDSESLQGNPIGDQPPANGDVLTWTGAEWAPVAPAFSHSDLSDLAADDHPQYILTDGTRAFSGNIDAGGNNLVSIGLVDGRDVSADGSTLDSHTADTSNPHSVTASQVGAPTQAEFDSHSARHESGGVDEINVGGLAGELADPQPPKSHGNEAHDVAFATQADLDSHTGDFNNPHKVTAAQIHAIGRPTGGANNGAADFDGTTVRVVRIRDVDQSRLDFLGPWTLSFVGNPVPVDGDHPRGIISKSTSQGFLDDNDSTFSVAIRVSNDEPVIQLSVWRASNGVHITLVWAIPSGLNSSNPYRFVFTYDPSKTLGEQKLYTRDFTGGSLTDMGPPTVSGGLENTVIGNLQSSTGPVTIGQHAGLGTWTGSSYKDHLDDVVVWDRLLSESEIVDVSDRTLSDAEAQDPDNDPAAYWKFDDESFEDSTLNGNDLSVPGYASGPPLFIGPLFGGAVDNETVPVWDGADASTLKSTPVSIDNAGDLLTPGRVDASNLDDAGDPRPPESHGNEAHDVAFATQADLTAHTGDTSNPHSVTASQVGNDTAQWNADRLQSRDVSSTAPEDGQPLLWNESASEWQPGDVAPALPQIGEIASSITNDTVAISTSASFVKVGVSTSVVRTRGFSMPSDGVLRLIDGPAGGEYFVKAILNLFANGNDFEARARLAVNDTTIERTEIRESIPGGASGDIYACLELSTYVNLNENDEVSLYLGNWTGTSDVTVTRLLLNAARFGG